MRTRQQTIEHEVSLEGTGLHTGERVRVALRPAPPDAGVVFRRSDISKSPALTVRHVNLDSSRGRTTLELDGVSVQTVEHLLAALSTAGVDNAEVVVEGPELPGTDGSAAAFVEALAAAGLREQEAPLSVYLVDSPIFVRTPAASLAAVPARPGDLRISYSLYYRESRLARGHKSLSITSESFAEELASARTFCMAAEVEKLLALGLGKGATPANTLVLEENAVRENTLRFPDEPVRHKMLDLLGDLAILGAPLSAHVMGSRSGHTLNRLLVRKILRLCKRVSVEELPGDELPPSPPPPPPPPPPHEPQPAPLDARAGEDSGEDSLEKGDGPAPEEAAREAAPQEEGEAAREAAPQEEEARRAEMLDAADIMEVLPHRYPFLMIDRILDLEPGRKVVAVKNLTRSEPFFRGHFPGRPVTPGVLQVEAMAQAAGLILGRTDILRNRVGLLAGVEKLRFRRPLLPGDRMVITVTLDRMRGPFAMISGRIEVEGEIAAEGQLRFAVIEPEMLAQAADGSRIE